ncbi:NAD-dependent epimerase/dehydratase family protein [Pseudobacteriovorax antillogorgiicola]|uniref:UDP-glucose 4-epimerase n=1 Tax=Pseudobacteriovorax antillogorgiicola TaxID=1513793 RepID=A0A1Y6CSU8_9BACT|nr:NAD-dependent epimerase/dehydratase family protein [Pseudobacteriovorax antillogorgiicola]TCS45207.1 UDP-glucose 4-epimerase [Pseudobacteriovorax antillogorgiicola]SMF75502.1 UDP-glucose 4-epimerase [Pseudobacteriovorax antillogorgiicola]
MMKILVTGWHGFLGFNLTQLLLENSYQVFGASRSCPPRLANYCSHDYFTYISCDISDPRDLKKLPHVDFVVHLAGNTSASASNKSPRFDFEQNLIGTFNLLEWASRGEPTPFILSSTAKIYPLGDNIPRSFYGTSKYAADIYAQEFQSNLSLPLIINRFVTLYGPHQYSFSAPDKSWVNWFIQANLQGKSITLAGNGDQRRDPLYVLDAAHLILKQIKTPEMMNNIFDVGGGVSLVTTPRDVVRKIVYLTKNDFTKTIWRDLRIDEKPTFIADISKLEPYWKPKTGLHSGLASTLQWMRKTVEHYA